MSRWRDVVRRELHRYREQTGYDVVERQELLEQALPLLEREFPDAKTPDQTLSRVLQELRDRDELEFLDYGGTYRIGDLAYEPTGSTEPEVSDHEYEARTYETTVKARSMPAAFRDAVLSWYEMRCPVSGVDHAGLLDVAHVLSWSDHPDIRTDPGNVLPLDKTHHEAFDRGLFTIDDSSRLQVKPGFSTESDLLRESLVDRDGQQLTLPSSRRPAPAYLRSHNEAFDWM
jgi:putative restriction endonuclease